MCSMIIMQYNERTQYQCISRLEYQILYIIAIGSQLIKLLVLPLCIFYHEKHMSIMYCIRRNKSTYFTYLLTFLTVLNLMYYNSM